MMCPAETPEGQVVSFNGQTDIQELPYSLLYDMLYCLMIDYPRSFFDTFFQH